MPLNHRHGGPFIESLCFFNAFHSIGIVAAEPGCFSNAFLHYRHRCPLRAQIPASPFEKGFKFPLPPSRRAPNSRFPLQKAPDSSFPFPAGARFPLPSSRRLQIPASPFEKGSKFPLPPSSRLQIPASLFHKAPNSRFPLREGLQIRLTLVVKGV